MWSKNLKIVFFLQMLETYNHYLTFGGDITHTHVHAHTHTNTHTLSLTHTHTYIYIYICVCVCVCVYVCVCMHVCAFECVCVYQTVLGRTVLGLMWYSFSMDVVYFFPLPKS